MLRLRRGSQKRQDAVEQIFAALRIEPAVHGHSAQFIRRQRKFPLAVYCVPLEGAAPVRGESVRGGKLNFCELRRQGDGGFYLRDGVVQERRANLEAVQSDGARRIAERRKKSARPREIAFGRAIELPSRRQTES